LKHHTGVAVDNQTVTELIRHSDKITEQLPWHCRISPRKCPFNRPCSRSRGWDLHDGEEARWPGGVVVEQQRRLDRHPCERMGISSHERPGVAKQEGRGGEAVPEEPTCFPVHFSHARRAPDQSAAIGEVACAAMGRLRRRRSDGGTACRKWRPRVVCPGPSR
jgi:hypothetical protein